MGTLVPRMERMPITGRKSRTVKLEVSPIKRVSERLPWPRMAEDDSKIELGVDVRAKQVDIVKIVHKFFRVPDVTMEELLQEVFLAIIHKNHTRSAHDSRKSSFGHYVYMVANNVCINLVQRKKRYDKEKESLDAPVHHDDAKTLLDTVETPVEEPEEVQERIELLEAEARSRGMMDAARYIHATRSGASPEIIREALSWGDRKMTTKSIRDIRSQLKELAELLPA